LVIAMADSSNTVEPETNPGTAAILNRLKEIENNNQSMQATIERLHTEAQMKEEKIKALSAEKRKDMEQMIDTAIDHWLNSLTGVPEEVRKQFRQGISKIAQEADMKNAAWEVDTPFFATGINHLFTHHFFLQIVCNASEAHNRNVKQIETLINTCAEQGKTIESLLGSDPSFSTDASRIAGVGHKRTRVASPAVQRPAAAAPMPSGGGGSGADAWDLFSNMMSSENKGTYY
jgi:hypothetical protein